MRVLAEPGVGNGSWQIQIRRKDSKKLVLPCLAVQLVRLMRLLVMTGLTLQYMQVVGQVSIVNGFVVPELMKSL